MKKMTLEEARRRISTNKDISLIEYNGWKKLSKFYDHVICEYFYTLPVRLENKNSGHPKRALEVRKRTVNERYGTDNVSKIGSVIEQKKQASLEKWGTECTLHAPEIRKQINDAWIEKYGTIHPHITEDVKIKIKQSIYDKYGVESFSQTEEYRKMFSNRFIIETGEHARTWLDKQSDPKPNYNSIQTNFKNEPISLSELESFVGSYKINTNLLETAFEELLVTKHYKKEILGRKPDFKLSDTLYVNVDGLYWHCDKNVPKDYHSVLFNQFYDNGLEIFQFRSDEVFNKPNIVKSIVNMKLEKYDYELDCCNLSMQIVNQNEASLFLTQNNLKGDYTGKHAGLYNSSNELIYIISYRIDQNILYVERFGSKLNINVSGAFNKLLSFAADNLLISQVHLTLDLRYENCYKLLEENGFKLLKEKIDWCWNDRNNVYPKSMYTDECKLYKIYDAGQRTYIKHVNS